MPRDSSASTSTLLRRAILLAIAVGAMLPAAAAAQEDIRTRADGIITISRGSTAILTRPDSITRILIADPEVAEPVVIPPNQVLINAKAPGSTSLVIWGRQNLPRLYTVEVTADVASLQRQMDELFPQAGLAVTSTGSSIVLSGEVRDPQTVRKATELATAVGLPIVNNIQAPAPEQILLHVEFAEVTKSALKQIGGEFVRLVNPEQLGGAFDREDHHAIETFSEGVVTLLVEGNGARLEAILDLLKSSGEFRSLAEPNLVTREGQEASFLAGGEFPFPTVQGGDSEAITITWKEFGVRLNFLPTITNSGNVRLLVEPEVSSLDFGNGLSIAGFNIPALLARRVRTDVELRPGQTLAIGGLMDNSVIQEVNKIPLLGDIPILGTFFRSHDERQRLTELLVLVTPYVLDANDLPAPPVPTGEPSEWDWDSHIRRWLDDGMNRRWTVGDTATVGSRP